MRPRRPLRPWPPPGKYHRDHNALEVTPTGRYFTEMMLNGLMQARYVGPTGPQD